MVEPIDVLGRIPGPTWIGADRRVHDEDFQKVIAQTPAIEIPSRKIDDTDTIGLADRLQRAFPHPHPIEMRDKIELRAIGPQFSILFFDR